MVQADGSDTAVLDNVFGLLVRAGRDAPMAKALMILASIGQDATVAKAHRDMSRYDNAIMKPRDGPAAIAATDGHWIIAGLDRNGLRPLRYTITKSDLSIVGSAIGMVQLDVIVADDLIQLPRRAGQVKVLKGGPVETGRGFVMHSSDFFIENSTLPIDEGICLTATLDILKAIARGKAPRAPYWRSAMRVGAPANSKTKFRRTAGCTARPTRN